MYIRTYFFFFPLDAALEETPTKYSKVRSIVGGENLRAASVVTAPPVNIFQKRLEQVWTEVYPHLDSSFFQSIKSFSFGHSFTLGQHLALSATLQPLSRSLTFA